MKVFAANILLFTLATGPLAAAVEGSFEKSLVVSGPVELDVKTDSGGITVGHGSSGSVRVHAVLKGEHGWFSSGDVEKRIRELERNPPVEQNGNRVRVGYVRDNEMLKGISMRLEIETPVETQLRAQADSGGIHVEGIRGPVDCKTDSGGIEANDISANVHAAADSGGIHVSNVQGSLFAHVDSGGIEASGIAGSIDAQADSGGVTVTLARGAGYDVSAETESGHISTPEMTVHSSFSSHHIEGKVGGGGPLVKIRVDSGSVTIN